MIWQTEKERWAPALATLPAPGKPTFVVEEAAIHQDEPALVPLLNPGAGLQDGRDSELGRARGDAVRRSLCQLQGHLALLQLSH